MQVICSCQKAGNFHELVRRKRTMIIEKKVDPILHRQKCGACGYYTVYQAIPAGDTATDTCTYCGHQVQLNWHPDLRAAFKSNEKVLKDMEEIFPELEQLKSPGDHILLD